MTITETKLEAKIHQARQACFLAGDLVCDVFCADYRNFDEKQKLMDKLSAAEKMLKGRYEALQDLYETAYEETYHTKSESRMWDSYWKYRKLAETLAKQEEMRATA